MFDDYDSNRPTARTRWLGNVLVVAAVAFFWLILGTTLWRVMHG